MSKYIYYPIVSFAMTLTICFAVGWKTKDPTQIANNGVQFRFPPQPIQPPIAEPPRVEPPKPKPQIATDAIDEVNATRAKRGLKPFVRDEGLTQAAMGAAAYRAKHLISGHTSNDFKFLPPVRE